MSSSEPPRSDADFSEGGNGAQNAGRDNIHTQFLKEACILLLGVAIGFLWHMYFSETSQEAHLVVMLSIVILCMVRYIYLIQRSRS
jgi:RsiW-degrading membrane proteinase PrsW (M82 family)